MCLLTTSTVAAHCPLTNPSAAKNLSPDQRQTLAIQALAGTSPITLLATELQVSRKFVYQQQSLAQEALDSAFDRDLAHDEVLFQLPITKHWIEQFILGLVLIGHCPLRGVVELFRDFFDYSISLGTVHNVVHRYVHLACQINIQQNLDGVRVAVHDEIFQNGQPVLVGADAASTYCYLMALETHRDTDTWGSHVLTLTDRDFKPDAVIADAGSGLRSGLKAALPDVPCRSDVFHAFKEVQEVVRILENQAFRAIEAAEVVRREIARLHRRGKSVGNAMYVQCSRAKRKETHAIELADDVALLADWLRRDVLAVAGPPHSERLALFEFILSELKARVSGKSDRLGKLVRYLSGQRDDLLAFARELDGEFAKVGQSLGVAVEVVREQFAVNALPLESPQRWHRDAPLRRLLGDRHFLLSQKVDEIRRRTFRASSLVENINGRLRGYFFLRRHLGNEYLGLLQFFLNHRRFVRSSHEERVGKSPAELLSGQEHPHWVEMLGFKRFTRA